MSISKQPEVWLRGPLIDIPTLLQPIAHALLQSKEEIHELMNEFPESLLWQKPAGVASPGFHLQHITGVLDRLFTYAQGDSLSQHQLEYLEAEGKENAGINISLLLATFYHQIDTSLAHLKTIDPITLTESRSVGRQQLPSTVLGLLFHAAEHTMRHTGQLLVTVQVLKAQ